MDAPTIDQEGRARGPDDLPDGDYAYVEVMGKRQYVAAVTETKRFGVEGIVVEPLFDGRLQGPIFLSGGAIFGVTPLSKEAAWNWRPRHRYQTDRTLKMLLPPPAEAERQTSFDDLSYDDEPVDDGDGEFDEDERPF